MDFQRNENTDYMFSVLTSPKITEMSRGRIQQMSPQQAAGLLGSWMVETGDPSLKKLDVVETQGGAGRGLSQYTGVRRIPYDRARAAALSSGLDPNQASWQMQYFADEYSGRYDQQGRSLIGWTRSLDQLPPNLSSGDYAELITGSASKGQGYFRPGVPHTDRRRQAAQQVFKAYSQPAQPKSIPTPTLSKDKPKQEGFLGAIKDVVQRLGIPLQRRQ
jgi:hypothetical protein